MEKIKVKEVSEKFDSEKIRQDENTKTLKAKVKQLME